MYDNYLYLSNINNWKLSTLYFNNETITLIDNYHINKDSTFDIIILLNHILIRF